MCSFQITHCIEAMHSMLAHQLPLTTVSTLHVSNCFDCEMYAPQTSRYQNIAKLLTHPNKYLFSLLLFLLILFFRYLYFTDWGSEPKVVRTLLDGTEAEILKEEGLSSPNGLTVDNGQLYLTDSNYNNKTSGAQILVFSTATNEWKQMYVAENLKVGLRSNTVYTQQLLLTSWKFHWR